MTNRDIVLSKKESAQIEVMEKLLRKEIRQKDASSILNISVRQIKRKFQAYKKHGVQSLVHKNKNKPSNNKIDSQIITKAIEIVTEKYFDFGPTLAAEKLEEIHNIKVSSEKLRLEMIRSGIWKNKSRKKAHVHQLRERRSCFGELKQLDGSPHDWFEGRGPKCNLNVCIDDSNNKINLHFSKTETTLSYFKLIDEVIKKDGIPLAIYTDKHSIFKVNKSSENYTKPSKSDHSDFDGLTQFGRAMKELGIELICANTPQAKGRVERMNSTLQDRLVKELRINNISSIEDANNFLPKFLENFSKKFTLTPASNTDMHRVFDNKINLDNILCIKEYRTLSKNLTCQYKDTIYQIKTNKSPYTLRKTSVTIREHHNGSISIVDSKNKNLDFSIFKKVPKNLHTDSKELNSLVDDIILKKKLVKKDPFALNLDEPNLFHKPMSSFK